MVITGIVVGVTAVILGWIAISHWRRQRLPIIEGLGLRWEHDSICDLLAGMAIAAFAMLGIFVSELWSGNISRGAITAASGLSSWQATLLMIFTAPEEEFVNRSLILTGLAIALRGRTKAAVLVTALGFGVAHLTNPGASALSGVGNALGGLIYGYAFVMSGRIWLPVGLHFAWNVVQGPILGFPVSGLHMGGLQHINDLGPALITGGSYGPEAGLVGISFRFVELALVFFYVHFGINKDRRLDFKRRVSAG
jgi:hypothetical protein